MTPGGPSAPAGPNRSPEEVLRSLELLVTHRLDGLLQGDYLGLLPGPGSEPGEGRTYQEGDDIRRIDWNLTARTNVAHVRDAVADRELETWMLVDGSPSLDFGTARAEKRDLAVAAVAAVGFLTARAGNRTGAVVLTPDGPLRFPARPGRQAVRALVHSLVSRPRAVHPGPGAAAGSSNRHRTDLGAGIELLLRPPRRRGLAVVVSDFLSAPGWERPLRSLAQRHQVLAVEIVDPRELELPDVGHLSLVDPETGRRRDVHTASPSLRQRYAEAAATQRASIASAVRATGAHHLVLRTDRDWVGDIVAFVSTARRNRNRTSRPVRARTTAGRGS